MPQPITAFGETMRERRATALARGGKPTLDPIDVYIGQRMRCRRLELHLSQEHVGRLLGVTFQQMQKYEKGLNRVAGSTLQRLARALQVTVSYFFEGSPGEGAASVPLSAAMLMMTSREGVVIAEAFVTIRNPQLRKAIADFVEQLAASREPRR